MHHLGIFMQIQRSSYAHGCIIHSIPVIFPANPRKVYLNVLNTFWKTPVFFFTPVSSARHSHSPGPVQQHHADGDLHGRRAGRHLPARAAAREHGWVVVWVLVVGAWGAGKRVEKGWKKGGKKRENMEQNGKSWEREVVELDFWLDCVSLTLYWF